MASSRKHRVCSFQPVYAIPPHPCGDFFSKAFALKKNRIAPFQIPISSVFVTSFKNNTLHSSYNFLEIRGFEPLTSSLQSWRSSQLSYIPDYYASNSEKRRIGGDMLRGFGTNSPISYTRACLANPSVKFALQTSS